ncbi:hypothetical protein JYU29_00620 [Tianweitania sp. BSSL-BM11]|uniref:Uncharacterized protein n=1 Tax=Tianweitania aestuarii TaxID=2814886 RepID=A0ABS5RQ73_9HYPH|nr:hypothetical protein [Tianweitania aestuarii]MBS9719185.1 hypothetical protein [Tianweitania aestuarii]
MDMQASIGAIVVEQFTDPFRIGMILFLAITSANTAHATTTRAGRSAPLVLGALFIAVLIGIAFHRDAPDMLPRMLIGIPVNGILLVIMIGLLRLWKRMRN